MPAESKAVVDSYIGMDDPLKIYTLIHGGLIKLRVGEDKANRYAWFCQAVYKELKDEHDVIDGLQKIATANKLLPGQIAMNFVEAAGNINNYRMTAGGGIVAPFVDRLGAIAKQSGIELNECSLVSRKLPWILRVREPERLVRSLGSVFHYCF